MKIITSITAMQTQEGTRVAYTYSELDDAGNIVSRHNTGAFVALDADVQAAVQTLMDAARSRLDA